VTGSATGARNDLAVTNKFEVVLRPIQGEADPKKRAAAEWQEPPGTLPTAESSGVSGDENNRGNHSKVSSGKKHRVRKESKNPSDPSPSPTAKEVAQHAE
jgi:spore germination cell wall hydrolase CwlJ-like protein